MRGRDGRQEPKSYRKCRGLENHSLCSRFHSRWSEISGYASQEIGCNQPGKYHFCHQETHRKVFIHFFYLFPDNSLTPWFKRISNTYHTKLLNTLMETLGFKLEQILIRLLKLEEWFFKK
jgi:hypothetical protein